MSKQVSKKTFQQRSSSYKRNFGTPPPGPMPLPNLSNLGAGTSGSFTRTTYRLEIFYHTLNEQRDYSFYVVRLIL